MITVEAADERIGKTPRPGRIRQKAHEAACAHVHQVQPADRADPERLRTVIQDDIDVVVTDCSGLGAGGIRAVGDKPPGRRVEPAKSPVDRPDPQDAPAVFVKGKDEIAGQAAGFAGLKSESERLSRARGIVGKRDSSQSAAEGPDPDGAAAVREQGGRDRITGVHRSAPGIADDSEPGRGPRILVRGEPADPSALGADPESPLLVLAERGDGAVLQTVGRPGNVPELSESFPVAVLALRPREDKLVEPGEIGSDPQDAAAVFVERFDSVASQTGGIGWVVLISGENVSGAFTVEYHLVQTAAVRSDPEKSAPVAIDPADVSVADA